MTLGTRPRVLVIGGSLGGLTAALVLREIGCDVTVFEKTPGELDGRGAGIVLQPATTRWFDEKGSVGLDEVSTTSPWLRYLGEADTVAHEEPSTLRFTGWNTLYRTLRSDFGTGRYVLGEPFVGLDQDQDGVRVRFTTGRVEECDLVVFADGISSTARRRLLPGVRPRYAGYVGWRGTVRESEVGKETFGLLHDAVTYVVVPNSHIILYPIPGPAGETGIGRRLLNYVWYRNVPEGAELDELLTDRHGFPRPTSVHPGAVQQRYVDELRTAAREILPPAAAEVVIRTEHPFIQPILDIEVPQMAFGRVCLIGDAAFAARPHAAAGTAKAAEDGWRLSAALHEADGDVVRALKAWEPHQLELGRNLIARVRDMGRRSQQDNTWLPGDPAMAFGLYGPGK